MTNNAQFRALIIDDEPDIRQLMSMTLSRSGIQCTEAENVGQAIQALNNQDFHFCLTDMKLPDGNGMDFIALARKKYPRMPIAMITAFGNMEVAIEALKAGAFDFIAKPIDIKKLRNTVNLAIKLTEVPATSLIGEQDFSVLVGECPATATLKQQMIKVARSQAPTFLYGVHGCRTDEAAQLIHNNSAQRQGQLVTINCESYSEQDIITQVLAGSDSQQLLSKADEGTLYIRNISKLTLPAQAKLLDFLLNPQTNEQEINFRLLCSDDSDLSQALNGGEFRQDLYHHIKVVNLEIPSLQQRQADIAEITEFLIKKYANEWQMPELKVHTKAVQKLTQHDYQADIIELESVLKRAFTACDEECISEDYIQWPKQNTTTNSAQDDTLSINPNGDLESYLENIERQAIVQELEANRWNKTATAEKLGISFRTLRYRCKKLHID